MCMKEGGNLEYISTYTFEIILFYTLKNIKN